MDTKVKLQKQTKATNWKSFFNMRLFRYSFLHQLKSISTYVFVAVSIIYMLVFTIVIFNDCENFPPANVFVQLKVFLIPIHVMFIVVFIGLKSLQVFNEEIEDGTILILCSMPYSRFKMLLQKWISLQVICFFYSLIIILSSILSVLILSGSYDFATEVAKRLFKTSLKWILAYSLFQLLFSALMVLLTMFFNKVMVISSSFLVAVVTILLFLIPSFFEGKSDDTTNKLGVNALKQGINSLFIKNEEIGFLDYFNDPDLKEFFEAENWYTNLEMKETPFEGYRFLFEHDTIEKVHALLTNNTVNDTDKKIFSKGIKKKDVYIEPQSMPPNAMKIIFDMFKKNESKSFNVHLIDKPTVESFTKQTGEFGNVVAKSSNFTNVETKISNLIKKICKYLSDLYQTSNFIFPGEIIFFKSLAKQYFEKYNTSMEESTFKKQLKTKIGINSHEDVGYCTDNLVFQSLFLSASQIYGIIKHMCHFEIEEKEKYEEILSIFNGYSNSIRKNNYFNFMTHIAIIWNDEASVPYKEESSVNLSFNYKGEWEIKTKSFTEEDGSKKVKKYMQIKPGSIRRIVNPTLLCIVYLLISAVLNAALVWIVYRKNFV